MNLISHIVPSIKDHDPRNKIRQRLFSAFLCLAFVFSFCFICFAAPTESGSVTVAPYKFMYSLVGNSRVEAPFFTYSDDPSFGYVAPLVNLGRGSYRSYYYYQIPDLSFFSNEEFIMIEVAIGSRTEITNNNSNYITFYNSSGTVLENYLISDRSTSIVTLYYQGVNMNVYKNFLVLSYDQVESFIADVTEVSVLQYFDTQDSVGQAVFVSDLNIRFFSDINAVIGAIEETTSLILGGMIDIKKDLADLKDSFTTDKNPNNPEFDSNMSNANDIEQGFEDKWNDFNNAFNDKVEDAEDALTIWIDNPKIVAAFLGAREILAAAFRDIPVLGIVFSVGASVAVLSSLFAIASHAFRPSKDHDDSRFDSMRNYPNFSSGYIPPYQSSTHYQFRR